MPSSVFQRPADVEKLVCIPDHEVCFHPEPNCQVRFFGVISYDVVGVVWLSVELDVRPLSPGHDRLETYWEIPLTSDSTGLVQRVLRAVALRLQLRRACWEMNGRASLIRWTPKAMVVKGGFLNGWVLHHGILGLSWVKGGSAVVRDIIPT